MQLSSLQVATTADEKVSKHFNGSMMQLATYQIDNIRGLQWILTIQSQLFLPSLYLKQNGKMQNKFPDNDNFAIFHWFLRFMLVPMVKKSSFKVILGQDQTRLRKSNSRPNLLRFMGLKLLDF